MALSLYQSRSKPVIRRGLRQGPVFGSRFRDVLSHPVSMGKDGETIRHVDEAQDQHGGGAKPI
jgi:hypothetical protein